MAHLAEALQHRTKVVEGLFPRKPRQMLQAGAWLTYLEQKRRGPFSPGCHFVRINNEFTVCPTSAAPMHTLCEPGALAHTIHNGAIRCASHLYNGKITPAQLRGQFRRPLDRVA